MKKLKLPTKKSGRCVAFFKPDGTEITAEEANQQAVTIDAYKILTTGWIFNINSLNGFVSRHLTAAKAQAEAQAFESRLVNYLVNEYV